jgi:TRAP-type mannitol/chloroaromatic compound transport system permease small subunit
MSALAALAGVIDRMNEAIGRAVSWLTLLMVLLAFTVVVLRYVFSIGFVGLQESYVWLHGLVFMLGAGYTLLHESHVRVDILYRDAGPRFKAWVDLAGGAFLMLPILAVIAYVSWPYVADSWSRLEGSREAGGLPGLFLLKSAIIVFCVLTGLQGLSLMLRSFLVLAGRTAPSDDRFANG